MTFNSLSCFNYTHHVMQIQTITYKQNRNLGNYESESFEVTALLNEDDDPDECAHKLRMFVNTQLYPKPQELMFMMGKPGEDPDDEVQSF